MSREENLAATERAIARAAARRALREEAMAGAASIAERMRIFLADTGDVDRRANVVTLTDSAGQTYTVTVQPHRQWGEPDDDGDDDEIVGDPSNFDGGFGPDSYFARAMRKED